MANLKDIVATLAILSAGTLTLTGCKKEGGETTNPDEVKAGDSAGEGGGEATCSGEKTDEAEGGEEAPAEGSCSGEDAAGEGSCSGEAAAPEGEG